MYMLEPNNTEFYAFIDHLIESKGYCCFAPAKRYCVKGLRLKKAYDESLNNKQV